MNPIRNLLEGVPEHLPDELVQVLMGSPNVRIERIISKGHASPDGFWYDQPLDEWVLVVQGAATLRFDGEVQIDLKRGDFVQIPAHKRHRVEWTDPNSPTVWLAVHYKS